MHYLAEVVGKIRQAETLGLEVTPEGARRYGHFLALGSEAWAHATFAALRECEVDELESELGRPIPSAYREFLMLCNGLNLFFGSLCLYGRRTWDHTAHGAIQPYDILHQRVRRPKGILCCGSYSFEDGIDLLLNASDPTVVAHERKSGSCLRRWSSFAEFLPLEFDRLARQFGPRGEQYSPERVGSSTASELMS